MVLKIVKGENQKILSIKCDAVTNFDKSLVKLVKDMKETMKNAKGLGIAAPQVNINARVFIVTLGFDTKNSREVAMVNPEITYFSDNKIVTEEGCLSLPGKFGKVERSDEIVVKYFDEKGKEFQLKLEGMDAVVTQHELDHLNGVLFIDKLYKKDLII